MTQKLAIIQYMYDFGSITPMQAYSDLGITKLATRISEMKKDGCKIKTEMVASKNRYGKPTRFAKYSLAYESEESNGE